MIGCQKANHQNGCICPEPKGAEIGGASATCMLGAESIQGAHEFLSDTEIERYTNGECDKLAQSLHKATGWPIAVLGYYKPDENGDYGDDPDYGWVHAGVITPDGRFLDARGANSDNAILNGSMGDMAVSCAHDEEADDDVTIIEVTGRHLNYLDQADADSDAAAQQILAAYGPALGLEDRRAAAKNDEPYGGTGWGHQRPVARIHEFVDLDYTELLAVHDKATGERRLIRLCGSDMNLRGPGGPKALGFYVDPSNTKRKRLPDDELIEIDMYRLEEEPQEYYTTPDDDTEMWHDHTPNG